MKILFLTFLEGTIWTLPSSLNLSINWNWGSLLGITLILQVITGLFLSFFFLNASEIAFSRVIRIRRDLERGWIFRTLHSNGASLFFFFIFLHIGRGLYFGSFLFKETWFTGVLLVFVLIGTAFFGYVLPWGQIRFWGATVILRIASAIPLLGNDVVKLIWGDFSVRGITLNRLYRLHFILPFTIIALRALHLVFLHRTTSNNPLLIGGFLSKTLFFPLYLVKDLFGILLFSLGFFFIVLEYPLLLGDTENFLKADPLVTPVHIKPEWYFLFAYAILRCIPNKLGGVIFLVLRILVLLYPALSSSKKNIKKPKNKGLLKVNKFWLFAFCFFFLTWLGGKVAEEPYIIMAKLFTLVYFFSI